MEPDATVGAPADTPVCMMCNLSFDRPVQDAAIRHYIHSQTELQQVEDTFFTVFDILPEHKGKVSLFSSPNVLPFCYKCVPLVRNLVKIQKKLQDLENQVKRARDEIVSVLAKSGRSDSPQEGLNNNPNFQFKQLICEKWCPETTSETVLVTSGKASEPETAINGTSPIKLKPQPHRLAREILSITKRDEGDKLLLGMMPEDVEEVTCQICSKVCRSKEYLETHLRVHAQTTKLTCSFCGKIFLKVAALRKHLKSVHDHVMEEVVESVPIPEAALEPKIEAEPEKALVAESTEDVTMNENVDVETEDVATTSTIEPEKPRSRPPSRRNSTIAANTKNTTSVSPSVPDDRFPPKLVDQTRLDFSSADMEYEDEDYVTEDYGNGEEDEEMEEGQFEEDEQNVEEDPMIDPALFLPQAGKFKYTTKSVIVGHYCRMCRKTYATTSTLRKHIHVVHLKQKRLDCPICQISVGDHYTLTKHVARHDPALTRVVFNCTECGEGAVTRRAIERHYAIVHPEVKIPENPLVRALRKKEPLDIVVKPRPRKYSDVPENAATASIPTLVADTTTEANTTDEESTTLITPAAAASAVVPVVNRQYTKKKKKPKSVFLYKRKRRHGRRRGGPIKNVPRVSEDSEPEITVDVELSAPATEVETVETDRISIKEAQEKNPYLRAMNFNLSLTVERCDLTEHGSRVTNSGPVSDAKAKNKPRLRRSVSPKKRTSVSEQAAPEVVPPVLLTRGTSDWKSKGAWFTQKKSSTLSALTKSTFMDGEKSTPVSLPANWKSFGAKSNSLTRSPTPASSVNKTPVAASASTAAPSDTQNPNTLLHAMLSNTTPRPKSLTNTSSSTLQTPAATASYSVPRAKTPVRILPAPPKVKSPEGNKSGYWADPSNILLTSATSTAPSFFQQRSGGPGSPTKTKKLAAINKSINRELPKSNTASAPKPKLQSSINKLVRNVKKSGIGNLNAIPFGKGTSSSESPMEQAQGSYGSGIGGNSSSGSGFSFTNRNNDEEEDYIDPSEFLQVESSTDDLQNPAQFIEKSTNSAFRNDFQALLRNPNVNVSMVPPDVPKPSKPGPASMTRIVSQTTGTLPSGIRLVPVEDVLKGNTEDRPNDPLSSPPTKKRLVPNLVPRFLLPKPGTNQSGEHGQLSNFITVVSTKNSTNSYNPPAPNISTGIPLSQIYESDQLDIDEVGEEEEEFSPIRIRSIQSLREPEPQVPSGNRFPQELAEDVNQYQPRIVPGSVRPSLNINISQARTQPQQTVTSRNIIGATPVLLPPITRPILVQVPGQTRARLTAQSQWPNKPITQYHMRNRLTRPQMYVNRKYRADEQKGVMKYSDYLLMNSKMDQSGTQGDANFQLPIRTSPALQLQTQQPSLTSNNRAIYMLVPATTPVSNSITLPGSNQSISTARFTTTTPSIQLAPNLVQVAQAHNQIDINPFLGQ